MQFTQRILLIAVTIELPLEHAYLDSELVDILKIQSEYPEVKVISTNTLAP
jgi:hypothetical protein